MVRAITRTVATTLSCLALWGCATSYGEWKFGRVGGYKQERLTADRWLITGIATSQAGPTFGYDMALYRGAILVKAAGYNTMSIVDFPIFDRGVYGVTTNQIAKLTIVGSNDPKQQSRCEASKYFEPNCRVLNVDEVVSDIGSRVGRTRADAEQEIAAARLVEKE